MTPRAVLPKCGSPDRPSARIRSLRGRNTEPGGIGGQLHAVGEPDTRPWILGEQQVPVEVDVVHEARDVRARGDPESGLDHAAEHHAEPQRAGGVEHAYRLADAAGLRQLDVDPVRPLRARGDIAETVTVLVDEDRNGRA